MNGRTTCFDDQIREGLCGLNYIVPCLMSHEPVDLLIIMLGTNDTKERFAVSGACIGLGLKRLVEKAKAEKEAWRDGEPNILIVCPKNIEKEYESTLVAATMGRGCAEKSEELAREFKKIARWTGCGYLDANRAVTVGQNHYDYMHLTREGHRQLAEALEAKVREIFP